MFIAVAVGLALPYVVLSWNPKWLRFLPKPGPWMEKFKIAMGFPMLGTAMWLFMLTYEYYGDRILWFGIFLTLLAMAVWVFGEFFQRGTRRKGLALAMAGLMTLGGVVFGLEGQLQWRNPIDPNSKSAGVVQDFPGGIKWHTWSPEAVAAAQKNGQPVLVDFTAKWCVTCIANKKTSIDIESVRAVLVDKNIKAFRADYTRRPDHITRELTKWNRAGCRWYWFIRRIRLCKRRCCRRCSRRASFWMRLERLPADLGQALGQAGDVHRLVRFRMTDCRRRMTAPWCGTFARFVHSFGSFL